MNLNDRRILNRLQDGIPICERPFDSVAKELNLSGPVLIERLKKMVNEGLLTRFGPMYDVEKLGGVFTLCAMRVPPQEFEAVADVVNSFKEVAHNYEREHDYNMWFVIGAESKLRVAKVIKEIQKRTGIAVMNLPKQAEYCVELKLKV